MSPLHANRLVMKTTGLGFVLCLCLLSCAASSTDAPPWGDGTGDGTGRDAGKSADAAPAPDAEKGVPPRADATAPPSADAGADAATTTPTDDAGAFDASFPQPAPPPPPAGPVTITVFPPVGSVTDDPTPPHGPGLVLMGGGSDVDSAFVWMHDVTAGTAAKTQGDVVVLRATGDNAYDAYIAGLAKWNSVRTILLPPPSTLADLALTASYVDKAEAVFFAGGNQADYVRWKGTVLSSAIARVYARGGMVGGTSAGCAVQGPTVFDSIAAGSTNVQTADAVKDPFESSISFTRDMFAWPTLGAVVTDPHFQNRDRFGRLATFVARQFADGAAGADVLGVGIDEGNALLVDAHGLATLAQQTAGAGGRSSSAPPAPLQTARPRSLSSFATWT